MRAAAWRGVARTPRPRAWRRAPRRGARARVSASSGDEPRDALGGQDFIYSQRSGVSESLFKGDLLGVDADVASGDLRARGESSRDLSFIRGEYHVPERFLERFAAHVAKNYLVVDEDDDDDDGAPMKNVSSSRSGLRAAGVPLILGIWGGKGAASRSTSSCVAATWTSRLSSSPRASWRTRWRANPARCFAGATSPPRPRRRAGGNRRCW